VKGDAVVGVCRSIESGRKVELMMVPFAGQVMATYGPREMEGENAVIWHDSPFRTGKSGGPLIGREGQLLRINHARCLSVEMLLNWRMRCPTECGMVA